MRWSVCDWLIYEIPRWHLSVWALFFCIGNFQTKVRDKEAPGVKTLIKYSWAPARSFSELLLWGPSSTWLVSNSYSHHREEEELLVNLTGPLGHHLALGFVNSTFSLLFLSWLLILTGANLTEAHTCVCSPPFHVLPFHNFWECKPVLMNGLLDLPRITLLLWLSAFPR